MNEVLRQLAARKSVRVYTGEPVTAEEKQAILQAAFDAPTAGCQQLYTILDITDQPLKERLADLCDHQPFIAAAPLVPPCFTVSDLHAVLRFGLSSWSRTRTSSSPTKSVSHVARSSGLSFA